MESGYFSIEFPHPSIGIAAPNSNRTSQRNRQTVNQRESTQSQSQSLGSIQPATIDLIVRIVLIVKLLYLKLDVTII